MQYKSLSKSTSRKIIPQQLFFSQHSPIYIPLFSADRTKKIHAVWELQLENGERNSGNVKRNAIQLRNLPTGSHLLTLITGKPILGKGSNIYQCTINIK